MPQKNGQEIAFRHLKVRRDMEKDQAIKLGESKFWETMSFKERALFQFFEPLLCMPFDIFHEAIEKTLGLFLHMNLP